MSEHGCFPQLISAPPATNAAVSLDVAVAPAESSVATAIAAAQLVQPRRRKTQRILRG